MADTLPICQLKNSLGLYREQLNQNLQDVTEIALRSWKNQGLFLWIIPTPSKRHKMATPKKKHLIELMIEAGVEWPEGAEYAAQDKDSLRVIFYEKGRPFLEFGANYRDSLGGSLIRGLMIKLPSLCRNWHQTIVTREQYAKAIAKVKPIEQIDTQQKPQYCTSVMRQMPSETIESLLAEIKTKREEHGELVAKVDALVLEITSIEQQVNSKLKECGFSLYPVATSSETAQPVITDWRDLRVGDVIWISESDIGSSAPAGEYSIVETEIDKCVSGSKFFLQPVGIDCHHIHMGVQCPNLQYRKWRFIRRP